MLATTSGVNGTWAQGKHRYWVQWVIEPNGDGNNLRVRGYCVRDMSTFNGDIVFEHASKIVCDKIAELLNDGQE